MRIKILLAETDSVLLIVNNLGHNVHESIDDHLRLRIDELDLALHLPTLGQVSNEVMLRDLEGQAKLGDRV